MDKRKAGFSDRRSAPRAFIHIVALALAMACATAMCAEPAAAPRRYPLQSTDPAPIIEAVEVVVNRDRITYDRKQNALIVTATADQHAQIARLVREMDAAPVNVQIQVRIQSVLGESGGRAGASLQLDPNGRNRFRIDPKTEQADAGQASTALQRILVASGREAAIHMLSDTAFVTWVTHYGEMAGYLVKNVTREKVGINLWVQPTVLENGARIQLKFIPELSYVVDGRRQTVRYLRETAEVTVRNGQSVDLGGAGEAGDFMSTFLTGLTGFGRSKSTTLTLIPRVVAPATGSGVR